MHRLWKCVHRGNVANENAPELGSPSDVNPDHTNDESSSTDTDWVVVNHKNEIDDDPKGAHSDQQSSPDEPKPSIQATIIIELGHGPNRTLCKVRINQIPHHCQTIHKALKKHPDADRILVQNLEYKEFTTYLRLTRSKYQLDWCYLRDERWMEIVQLGIAAEHLEDLVVRTYVCGALSEKSRHTRDIHDMFDSEVVHYVYNRTRPGSPLRNALAYIGIEWPTLSNQFDGPRAFFQDIENEVDNNLRRLNQGTNNWKETLGVAKTAKQSVPSKKPTDSPGLESSRSPMTSQPAVAATSWHHGKPMGTTSPAPEIPHLAENMWGGVYRQYAGQVGKVAQQTSNGSPATASQRDSIPATPTKTRPDQPSSKNILGEFTRLTDERRTNLALPDARPGSSKYSRDAYLPNSQNALTNMSNRAKSFLPLPTKDDEGLWRPVRQPVVPPSVEDLSKEAGARRNFYRKQYENPASRS